MSAAHQMPQAQAERIVAAMVAGSRMANTEPSETDTHPRSDVLINWLGTPTRRLEDRRDQRHRPAHGQAAASVTRRSTTQQPESRACT